MKNCKICGKRLKEGDEKLCSECFDFYFWKYGDEEDIEQVLKQYEVQKNADHQKNRNKEC